MLQGVDLTIMPGEMLGVVGQNGSGKSTLAKVISGFYPPDRGTEIKVDGEALPVPPHLHDLRTAGIAIVHQDLGLIEDATVVENVRIAVMGGRTWTRRVDWPEQERMASPALQRLGYKGSLRTRVRELPPADRARVAIARATQDHMPGHGLLIFDESTRALPSEAIEEFYGTVRQLQDDGTAVLMIGHRLEEILAHCDRVTVLRDGRTVADGISTRGVSEGELATLMIGHALTHLGFEGKERIGGEHQATVSGLTGDGLAAPFDLSLAKGEIVGLTGLPGSGFESIPYLISGASPGHGRLELGGRRIDLATASVARLVKAGVALIPENRPKQGLALAQNVRDNIALPWLDDNSHFWFTGRSWQEEATNYVIGSLGVRPADPLSLVGRLSGGNQQKVVLGKWLIGGPTLLVMHEPTQGVDVRARQDLLGAIHEVAVKGASVLIASTEAEDLITVCNRVLVFRDGVVSDEIAEPEAGIQIVEAVYEGAGATGAPSHARSASRTEESEK